ncbi:hypothetical protein C8J57DRAFT_1517102 [Mycena rebaudengoi]|nr:hypothetical protein C8J57DRAFT_1517102 [Mycena rebaudengoi]
MALFATTDLLARGRLACFRPVGRLPRLRLTDTPSPIETRRCCSTGARARHLYGNGLRARHFKPLLSADVSEPSTFRSEYEARAMIPIVPLLLSFVHHQLEWRDLRVTLEGVPTTRHGPGRFGPTAELPRPRAPVLTINDKLALSITLLLLSHLQEGGAPRSHLAQALLLLPPPHHLSLKLPNAWSHPEAETRVRIPFLLFMHVILLAAAVLHTLASPPAPASYSYAPAPPHTVVPDAASLTRMASSEPYSLLGHRLPAHVWASVSVHIVTRRRSIVLFVGDTPQRYFQRERWCGAAWLPFLGLHPRRRKTRGYRTSDVFVLIHSRLLTGQPSFVGADPTLPLGVVRARPFSHHPYHLLDANDACKYCRISASWGHPPPLSPRLRTRRCPSLDLPHTRRGTAAMTTITLWPSFIRKHSPLSSCTSSPRARRAPGAGHPGARAHHTLRARAASRAPQQNGDDNTVALLCPEALIAFPSYVLPSGSPISRSRSSRPSGARYSSPSFSTPPETDHFVVVAVGPAAHCEAHPFSRDAIPIESTTLCARKSCVTQLQGLVLRAKDVGERERAQAFCFPHVPTPSSYAFALVCVFFPYLTSLVGLALLSLSNPPLANGEANILSSRSHEPAVTPGLFLSLVGGAAIRTTTQGHGLASPRHLSFTIFVDSLPEPRLTSIL